MNRMLRMFYGRILLVSCVIMGAVCGVVHAADSESGVTSISGGYVSSSKKFYPSAYCINVGLKYKCKDTENVIDLNNYTANTTIHKDSDGITKIRISDNTGTEDAPVESSTSSAATPVASEVMQSIESVQTAMASDTSLTTPTSSTTTDEPEQTLFVINLESGNHWTNRPTNRLYVNTESGKKGFYIDKTGYKTAGYKLKDNCFVSKDCKNGCKDLVVPEVNDVWQEYEGGIYKEEFDGYKVGGTVYITAKGCITREGEAALDRKQNETWLGKYKNHHSHGPLYSDIIFHGCGSTGPSWGGRYRCGIQDKYYSYWGETQDKSACKSEVVSSFPMSNSTKSKCVSNLTQSISSITANSFKGYEDFYGQVLTDANGVPLPERELGERSDWYGCWYDYKITLDNDGATKCGSKDEPCHRGIYINTNGGNDYIYSSCSTVGTTKTDWDFLGFWGVPKKDGKTFCGYYYNDNGTKTKVIALKSDKSQIEATSEATSDINKWKKEGITWTACFADTENECSSKCETSGNIQTTCAVTYNCGDGVTGTTPTQGPVSNGTTITLANNFCTNGNKIFAGWKIGERTYVGGDTVTITGNTTITAQWVDPITITYNLGCSSEDGCFGSVPSDKSCDNYDIVNKTFTCQINDAHSIEFGRGGYALDKWKDSSGEEYSKGSYATLSGSITLYAVWEPCSGNQYHPSEKTDVAYAGSCISCQDGQVPNNTKTGCIPEGSQNSNAPKLAMVATQTIVSNAVTGDVIISNGTQEIPEGEYNAADFATEMDGYDLTITVDDQDGSTFTAQASDTSPHVIKYAYKSKTYTLTVTDGAGIESVSGGGTYAGGAVVSMSATVKDGYNFDGWYRDNTRVSTEREYTVTMPSSNVTYTAKATIITYDITYDVDGGTSGANSPGQYTISETKNIPNPSRTGYTFSGWEITTEPETWGDGSSADGSTNFTIKPGTSGDIALRATWTPNTDTRYKVCYYLQNVNDNNYASDGCVNKTGTTDAVINNWAKNLDKVTSYLWGEGTSVYADYYTYDHGDAGISGDVASFQNATETDILPDGTRVINLYYNRKTSNVYVAAGTGIESVTIETDSVHDGDAYRYGASITIKAVVKDGYQWQRWEKLTKKGGVTNPSTINTQNKTFTLETVGASITFTALARLIQYNITYVNAGNMSSGVYKQGVGTTISAIPTKANYVFEGWCTDGDWTECAMTQEISASDTGDKTFYAKWAQCSGINGENVISASYAYIQNNECYYTHYCETGYYHQDNAKRGATTDASINCHPCTNKPEHARYVSGTYPTTNACEWECDSGYTIGGAENGPTSSNQSGLTCVQTSDSIPTPVERSITYHTNGGDNYSGAPTKYYEGIGVVIGAGNKVPTMDNNVFVGWCTDADLTDCAMTQEISASDTGNKEFWAKWSQCPAATGTSTFMNNNVRIEVENNECRYIFTCKSGYYHPLASYLVGHGTTDNEATCLPCSGKPGGSVWYGGGTSPETCEWKCWEGYTVDGKKDSADFGYGSGGSCVLINDIKVSYDVTDGNGSVDPTYCSYNKYCALNMTSTSIYRGGYKLKGWSSGSDGTIVYTGWAGPIAYTVNYFKANGTRYAIWEKCPKDTYHPDEESDIPANECASCPGAPEGSKNCPQCDFGYKMYIDAEDGETKCKKSTITLDFADNNGIGVQYMGGSPQSLTYGDSYPIPTTIYSTGSVPAGYKVVGFTLSCNNLATSNYTCDIPENTVIRRGEDLKDYVIDKVSGGRIKLVPYLEAVESPVALVFKDVDGSLSAVYDSVTATYGSDMPSKNRKDGTPLAVPSDRPNCPFKGFFDAQNGGNQYYDSNMNSARKWDKAQAGRWVYLYAQWNCDNVPSNSLYNALGKKVSLWNWGGQGGRSELYRNPNSTKFYTDCLPSSPNSDNSYMCRSGSEIAQFGNDIPTKDGFTFYGYVQATESTYPYKIIYRPMGSAWDARWYYARLLMGSDIQRFYIHSDGKLYDTLGMSNEITKTNACAEKKWERQDKFKGCTVTDSTRKTTILDSDCRLTSAGESYLQTWVAQGTTNTDSTLRCYPEWYDHYITLAQDPDVVSDTSKLSVIDNQVYKGLTLEAQLTTSCENKIGVRANNSWAGVVVKFDGYYYNGEKMINGNGCLTEAGQQVAQNVTHDNMVWEPRWSYEKRYVSLSLYKNNGYVNASFQIVLATVGEEMPTDRCAAYNSNGFFVGFTASLTKPTKDKCTFNGWWTTTDTEAKNGDNSGVEYYDKDLQPMRIFGEEYGRSDMGTLSLYPHWNCP